MGSTGVTSGFAAKPQTVEIAATEQIIFPFIIEFPPLLQKNNRKKTSRHFERDVFSNKFVCYSKYAGSIVGSYPVTASEAFFT